MIVARLIDPASKLGTARYFSEETAICALGPVLKFGQVDERELYAALDWLFGQHPSTDTGQQCNGKNIPLWTRCSRLRE